jgi:adenylate cyclase
VAALRLRVASNAPRRGTQNPDAYEMYLRGRQHLHELGEENGELARQTFKRAIALDPGFAQAHAGLADTDANMVQWLLRSKAYQSELQVEALAESDAALRLDPALAEAHVARANALSMLGRNAEADQSFRRAIELGPGSRDAWYWYARFLFSAKRYADSANAYEQVGRINPDDYDGIGLASMPYSKLGEQAKAVDAQRRSLAAAERVLKIRPDDVRALYLSGGALIQVGRASEGTARLDQAVALRPHDFAVLYNAACGFARAGQAEKAMDMLDRAVGTGQGFRAWIEQDPDLDSLRALPRYRQILARLPQ